MLYSDSGVLSERDDTAVVAGVCRRCRDADPGQCASLMMQTLLGQLASAGLNAYLVCSCWGSGAGGSRMTADCRLFLSAAGQWAVWLELCQAAGGAASGRRSPSGQHVPCAAPVPCAW